MCGDENAGHPPFCSGLLFFHEAPGGGPRMLLKRRLGQTFPSSMCDAKNTPEAAASLLELDGSPPPAVAVAITVDTRAPSSSIFGVRCQICLEDIDDLEATFALETCGHRFCAVCITAFLNVQITDGCVDLACFHSGDQVCHAAIAVDDIRRLVSPEMFAKYERFHLLRTNPQARECPFCSLVHVTTGSKQQPACVCTTCAKTFCFVHSDAHAADETCAQFEKRQSKREKRSGRAVRKISRPCPKCTQPIEKTGGCVHMTCSVCKAEYCWWCGETWGFKIERHYSLLDAECCSGIAGELVPGLNSGHTVVRGFARFLYYLTSALIGIPLTMVLLVVLSWAWVPAVWRGTYKVRGTVLVRYFSIRFLQATMTALYVVFLVVAFTVVVFADGIGWITRKVRALMRSVRTRIQRCFPPRQQNQSTQKETMDSDVESPAFVVLQDPEPDDEPEL